MIDWKLAMFILQLISTSATVLVFCVIKFNDLKHLSKEVKEIAKNMKSVCAKLYKIEKAVEKREAICEERHSK